MFACFFNCFFSTIKSIKSAGKLVILTPNLSTPANTIHETMKKYRYRVRLFVTNGGPNTYLHQASKLIFHIDEMPAWECYITRARMPSPWTHKVHWNIHIL